MPSLNLHFFQKWIQNNPGGSWLTNKMKLLWCHWRAAIQLPMIKLYAALVELQILNLKQFFIDSAPYIFKVYMVRFARSTANFLFPEYFLEQNFWHNFFFWIWKFPKKWKFLEKLKKFWKKKFQNHLINFNPKPSPTKGNQPKIFWNWPSRLGSHPFRTDKFVNLLYRLAPWIQSNWEIRLLSSDFTVISPHKLVNDRTGLVPVLAACGQDPDRSRSGQPASTASAACQTGPVVHYHKPLRCLKYSTILSQIV